MSDQSSLLARIDRIELELERIRKVGGGVVTRTWTPTYTGQSAAGVTTYTTQIGAYTLLGRFVFAMGRLVWTGATGTGVALIGGLPVAISFNNSTRFCGFVYSVNVTFANGSIQAVADSGTSTSAFVMLSPATNAAGTLLTVEAAGDLSFTIIYES